MADACPFQETLDLLSRRHGLTIIWYLATNGTSRFTALKRDLSVNQVTLSQRLSELEAAGIIDRQAHNEIPPRVDYTLTGSGRDLIPLLDALDGWAGQHGDRVVAALGGPKPPAARSTA